MKKIYLFLAVFSLFCMAGCGGSSDKNKVTEDSTVIQEERDSLVDQANAMFEEDSTQATETEDNTVKK